jgi:hypothetical protein
LESGSRYVQGICWRRGAANWRRRKERMREAAKRPQ